MEKFAVSFVFTQQTEEEFKMVNVLQVDIDASNKEEAFGIAYDENIKTKTGWQLFSKVVIKQA